MTPPGARALGVGLLCSFALQPLDAAADPTTRALVASLTSSFRDLTFSPLLVPRGQSVGDVQGLTDQSPIDSRKKCFPDLPQPAATPFDLPNLITMNRDSGLLDLGVKDSATITGRFSVVTEVSLSFSESMVLSLPLSDLAAALSTECDYLRPLFAGPGRVANFDRPVQVIHEVLIARRSFTVKMSSDTDIGGRFDDIKAGFTSLFGEKFNLSVQFKNQYEGSLILTGKQLDAVAFRPTHVPSRTLGLPGTPTLVPFDPTKPVQREVLRFLCDALVEFCGGESRCLD